MERSLCWDWVLVIKCSQDLLKLTFVFLTFVFVILHMDLLECALRDKENWVNLVLNLWQCYISHTVVIWHMRVFWGSSTNFRSSLWTLKNRSSFSMMKLYAVSCCVFKASLLLACGPEKFISHFPSSHMVYAPPRKENRHFQSGERSFQQRRELHSQRDSCQWPLSSRIEKNRSDLLSVEVRLSASVSLWQPVSGGAPVI